MPSQRKRIGFLPTLEIQKIIDKFCKHNKLSQSKVTGILVEEALITRGVLKNNINKLSHRFEYNSSDKTLSSNESLNSQRNHSEDALNIDNGSTKDEIQMINDFIEFKFFKNIMKKNM